MATTYEPIATQTVSAVSSVSFTSISSAYTDLRLVFQGSNGAVLMKMFCNNDTTNTNYWSLMMLGDGNSASTAIYNVPWLYVWPTAVGYQFSITTDILNYSNTGVYKSWIGRQGAADSGSILTLSLIHI